VDASFVEFCPAVIDKTVWLGGFIWKPDTFQLSSTANQITVTRTDKTQGWDFDLQFFCCAAGHVKVASASG